MDGWMKDERQHFLLRPPRGLKSAYQHSCVVTNLVEMCHLLGENFFSWLHGYEHTFLSVSAPGVLSRLDQLTEGKSPGHAMFFTQSFFPKVRLDMWGHGTHYLRSETAISKSPLPQQAESCYTLTTAPLHSSATKTHTKLKESCHRGHTVHTGPEMTFLMAAYS